MSDPKQHSGRGGVGVGGTQVLKRNLRLVLLLKPTSEAYWRKSQVSLVTSGFCYFFFFLLLF